MRKDGSLVYLHNDHLGSTALSTDPTGYQTGSATYSAEFILVRSARRGGDDVTTEFGFTGQRQQRLQR